MRRSAVRLLRAWAARLPHASAVRLMRGSAVRLLLASTAVVAAILGTAAFDGGPLGAPPLHAQEGVGPRVYRADMLVDATGDVTQVSIRYELHVPASIDRIPITLLTPEPAVVGGLTTAGHSRVMQGVLSPSETARRTGWLDLTPSPQAEDVTVTITYPVGNATTVEGDRSRTVVPVLAVDWPVEEALPGTFRARIQLPQDMVAYESFPTATGGLAGAGTDPGPSEVELSVVPAYLRVRARRGSAPLFSVNRAADLFVVLLLLALGAWGWSRLGSRRPEAA
jgi:hypothetical protein